LYSRVLIVPHVCLGSEIQQVTTAKILDASETNNFSKIETRVYKDPNVSGGSYIICNLMLSTSGDVIFAERSFIPGSGLSGESIQNFPNDTFIDIDVVESINACRYVALTDSVSHTRVNKEKYSEFFRFIGSCRNSSPSRR
jgi:hypothetical protein